MGDTHKLRCEARGDPPVTVFRWYKNEAPLIEEQQRLRVRDYLKPSSDSGGQSSILRFKELETLDTGFYRCEATNGLGETIKSTAVLKVNLGSGKYHRSGGGGGGIDEDDYVHLPSSFQDPFEELDNAFGGGGGGGGGGGEGGGLASQIEFQAGWSSRNNVLKRDNSSEILANVFCEIAFCEVSFQRSGLFRKLSEAIFILFKY